MTGADPRRSTRWAASCSRSRATSCPPAIKPPAPRTAGRRDHPVPVPQRRHAGQVRALSTSAQRPPRRSWRHAGPFLIAADQEGGQLIALGDGHDAVPGRHGARRDRRPGPRRAGWTRHGPRAAGDGRQRRLRTRLRPRRQPGQPAPRDPRVRQRPGGRRGACRRHGPRPAFGRRRGGRSSTSRASARSDLDTHHGLAVIAHDRARLDARRARPVRGGDRRRAPTS